MPLSSMPSHRHRQILTQRFAPIVLGSGDATPTIRPKLRSRMSPCKNR